MATHDTLDNQSDALGEYIETFKASFGTVVAGVSVGMIFIGGGGGVLWLSYMCLTFRSSEPRDDDLVRVIFGAFLFIMGLLFAYMGTLFIKLSLPLRHFSVYIHQNGFRFCDGDTTDAVLWSDVSHVREILIRDKVPVPNIFGRMILPKIVSRSYCIVTNAGTEYGFDGNNVSKINRFANLLRAEAARLSLSWTVEEVNT